MDSLFTITARAPITQASNGFFDTLATEAESYTITANVGFDSASFAISGDAAYLLDWYRDGLARDIVWKAPDNSIAWNGFVNNLTISIGGSRRARGLGNFANRVHYIYTTLDTSTSPPTAGAQAIITSNSTVGQENYPIKALSVSGGQKTTAAATLAAATELARRVKIVEEGSDSIGASTPATLRVDMLGYAWLLNWSLYRQVSSSGTTTRSALLQTIAGADDNSILSSDYSNVETNSETTAAYIPDYTPSWSLIQEIANEGGAGDYRWVAGVYEDRQLHYKQAEGVDDLGNPLAANSHGIITRSLYDAGERYFDAGQELAPWELRPDRLLNVGGLSNQAEYIQQVAYNAPYGVQLRAVDGNPLRGVLVR